MKFPAACVLVFVCSGCELITDFNATFRLRDAAVADDGGSTTDDDGGRTPDVRADASTPALDSGTEPVLDASEPLDASTLADAGMPAADSGPVLDASEPLDASTVADAGMPAADSGPQLPSCKAPGFGLYYGACSCTVSACGCKAACAIGGAAACCDGTSHAPLCRCEP